MRQCLFLRGSRMALDKWELSPESLLKGSLQVFGLSGLGHGSGLLVFDPLLCHLQPTSLPQPHSFRVMGSRSHGGCQVFCAGTEPLLPREPSVFSPPALPTGITLSLSIYGLHHNPQVWPNPEV